MFPVLALGGQRGGAELTEELDHLPVLLHVFLQGKLLLSAGDRNQVTYLEVSGMSELPVAVRAGEPGLVGVGHQVVVQTVLPGEGRPAQRALEWSEAGVTPENTRRPVRLSALSSVRSDL